MYVKFISPIFYVKNTKSYSTLYSMCMPISVQNVQVTYTKKIVILNHKNMEKDYMYHIQHKFYAHLR